jgi:hypothetical protein
VWALNVSERRADRFDLGLDFLLRPVADYQHFISLDDRLLGDGLEAVRERVSALRWDDDGNGWLAHFQK